VVVILDHGAVLQSLDIHGVIVARRRGLALDILPLAVTIFGPHVLDVRQLGALGGYRATDLTLLPRYFAFLKRSIAEFTAATQDERHRSLLFKRRLGRVLEGFAYAAVAIPVYSA
jgi:hypothetical protein